MCLRPLRARLNLVLHLRPLGQALEALTADRAEVDEDVLAPELSRSTTRARVNRRLLIGRDVLLVNTRVPIVDANGRAVALNRLDKAILWVKGTLLPAGQWRYDLDAEATPTVRVSRIVALSLAPPD